MGILDKIFRRGNDEQNEPAAATATAEKAEEPTPSVLSEDQKRARELLEKELEEKKAGSEGAPE